MRRLALCLTLAALTGCTAVNTARLVSEPGSGRDVFVTAGDISQPYESLGMVQLTRGGVLLFGFVDPVGTDLEAGLKDSLLPQIREMGGDGAIRVRFHQTQYLPVVRALFAFPFFFVPLPSQVVVTAEVVRLRPGGAPAPAAAAR